MQPQPLFIRDKPLEDELFSSWLVRLAWANGEKLHSFCRRRLGIVRNLWNHDIDRLSDANAIERSAAAVGAPIQRIFECTLAAYEGILYEHHVIKGVSAWIMPVGRYARTHTRHGQQYCPRCLAADGDRPYFRRRWRLAFWVMCPEHHTLMCDACWNCGAPVSFHEGDFGWRKFRDVCPIVFCPKCNADLRAAPTQHEELPPDLVRLHAQVSEALTDGWAQLDNGRRVHSILFFGGLRHLLRLLSSHGYTRAVRETLLAFMGEFALDLFPQGHPGRFEDLRIGDRSFLLILLANILCGWPTSFLYACRSAHISSSYIFDYKRPVPLWLEDEIRWDLDDGYYVPSTEERSAVERHLTKIGEPTDRNNINRWLGAWYVSRHKRTDSLVPLPSRHAGKHRGVRTVVGRR